MSYPLATIVSDLETATSAIAAGHAPTAQTILEALLCDLRAELAARELPKPMSKKQAWYLSKLTGRAYADFLALIDAGTSSKEASDLISDLLLTGDAEYNGVVYIAVVDTKKQTRKAKLGRKRTAKWTAQAAPGEVGA
jgi:hypothetical protein